MVNWRTYSESLVRRGQVMLDFDVIDRWEELEKMNDGKVGEPYHYPESFIQLLGYMRAYFYIVVLPTGLLSFTNPFCTKCGMALWTVGSGMPVILPL